MFDSKDINFYMNFPKDLPMVMGDIGMIERALSNLIENALFYFHRLPDCVYCVVRKQ